MRKVLLYADMLHSAGTDRTNLSMHCNKLEVRDTRRFHSSVAW